MTIKHNYNSIDRRHEFRVGIQDIESTFMHDEIAKVLFKAIREKGAEILSEDKEFMEALVLNKIFDDNVKLKAAFEKTVAELNLLKVELEKYKRNS